MGGSRGSTRQSSQRRREASRRVCNHATDKKAQIEHCLHEILSVQMSAHCFLLSKFQMSCRRETAHWYPMWYMIRRTILTVAYMDGLGNARQLDVIMGKDAFKLGAMPPVAFCCLRSRADFCKGLLFVLLSLATWPRRHLAPHCWLFLPS